MSINYHSVYLTQPTADFQVCHTDDISLYASHLYAFFDSATYACSSRVALEFGNVKITYQALNGKINLCAAGYLALGIEPGDLIVFSMEHSLALVVSILAALKIGAKICLFPKNMSAFRLREMQRSTSVALLVQYESQKAEWDIFGFHVPSISYQALMEKSIYSNVVSFYPNAFVSAAQVIFSYDAEKGLHSVEFPQTVFLKMLHELDDVVPAQQVSERMLITTPITQPLFLLELFYVFMRQSTAIFEQQPASQHLTQFPIRLPLVGAVRLFLEKAGWMTKSCTTSLELQGLSVSFKEMEYFARQYPGVLQAQASFCEHGLELRVKFSWDFYPHPFVHAVDLQQNQSPSSDVARLASRLCHFMSQHLWGELPFSRIVLEPA
jgi:hypothetical protein